jgi:hypothetical protein
MSSGVLLIPPGEYLYLDALGGGRNFTVWFGRDLQAPTQVNAAWLSGGAVPGGDGVYYTGAEAVTLSWTATGDLGTSFAGGRASAVSGLGGYKVYRNGGHVATVSGAVTNVSAAVAGGVNSFTVRAYDNAGNEGAASGAVVVVRDDAGPYAPGELELDGAVMVEGRGPFEGGDSLRFVWAAATDRGSAGVDPNGYVLTVRDEASAPMAVVSGASVPAGAVVDVSAWASGRYRATVRAVDLAGNEGIESGAYEFLLDRSAPPPVDLGGVKLDDSYSTATILDGELSLYTGKLSYRLGWSGVAEGDEPWQSGVMAYRMRAYRDGGVIEYSFGSTEELELSQSMLALGDYEYAVWVEDAVGNASEERRVTVKVMDPPPVSFSVPMYENTEEGYVFKWNDLDEEHDYHGPGIAYYGAIVRRLVSGMATPEREEFEPTQGTEKLFGDLPTNRDLVAYVLAVDVNGLFSIVAKVVRFPPLDVPEDQIYTLVEDEYWDGTRTVSGKVVVPEGIKLTMLPGAVVKVLGQGGAQVVVRGTLAVQGSGGSPVVFESGKEERLPADWLGILVDGGQGGIEGLEVRDAERGLTAAEGAEVVVRGSVFAGNRVGLHSYGARPVVEDCLFSGNEWYGIKEDGVSESGGKRPEVRNTEFTGNGYAYYHESLLTLSAEETNDIDGNEGNR